MTINGPWRLCFPFCDGAAWDVEIVDCRRGETTTPIVHPGRALRRGIEARGFARRRRLQRLEEPRIGNQRRSEFAASGAAFDSGAANGQKAPAARPASRPPRPRVVAIPCPARRNSSGCARRPQNAELWLTPLIRRPRPAPRSGARAIFSRTRPAASHRRNEPLHTRTL